MEKINNDLEKLYQMLDRKNIYEHACQVLSFDLETVAPEKGMADINKDLNFFTDIIYKIEKSKEFISIVKKIKKSEDFDSLNKYDKRLVDLLYRSIERNKNITPEIFNEAMTLFRDAYVIWLEAKKKGSYKEFAPTLEKIYKTSSLLASLEDKKEKNLYNVLFDDFEEKFTCEDLDRFFDELEQGLVPLVKEVKASSYVPRHDFIKRKVPIAKQEEFSRYLLQLNGFDFKRGSLSITEHPFTSQLSYNDVRVTTHYYEDNFISNMYSIIHEGGHAIFGQNVPKEMFAHRLSEGSLSMGKHESVSRFYENVIGRSREYITLIYPEFKRIFKEEFPDVSLDDLYEGVNYVDFNNTIRTEADELTYSLHILIRYRLERMIMDGKADFSTLNKKWNEMYKKILDVDVENDREGILQDVHWTSGFGYFPTYAMGNALNCIYLNKLKKDMNLNEEILSGHLDNILKWMKKNVFLNAPLLDTKTWIKKMTKEDFSCRAYIDYLTVKFKDLYKIK